MKLLSIDEVENKFADLPLEWSIVSGSKLELSSKFADFEEALEFVNEIGSVAEKLGHHPDISLSYGSVRLSVTTHSVGGLTHKDFELAKAIDKKI